MRFVVIIPARWDSMRLPGKPLADIAGKPMIRHVYERAAQAPDAEDVFVATDDGRVADVVLGFGGRALMTGRHASGTDRVAEAMRLLAAEGIAPDAVVNVQGDEPTLAPELIGQAVALLDDAPMSTLARPLEAGELEDRNVVKVVTDLDGRALYFSRAPLAAHRERPGESEARAHVGLYAYRTGFLETFANLAPTPLERAERLEQLRALEHGHRIAVGHTQWRGHGIDTPDDLERIRSLPL